MPGLQPSNFWANVLDLTDCGLFVGNHDLQIHWCNEAFGAVLGWSREQISTLDVPTLTHPDDRADAMRISSAALTELRPRSFVCRMLDAEGIWRWIRWDGRPVDEQTLIGRARRLDRAPSKRGSDPHAFGAIVHDFNNLLFALTGGIELAHEQLHEPKVLADTLTALGRAISQARVVNQRLLDLAAE